MSILQWVPGLGLFVGLALALTGAGGSIVAVPLLVFLLHLNLAEAAPIGLVAVAIAAAAGALIGLQGGVLRYKAAALMGAGRILLAPVGQWLGQLIPERPLSVLFAVVLGVVALRLVREAMRELRGEPPPRRVVAPCRVDPQVGKLRWTPVCAASLALSGAFAGLLSGLLGVGGGFVLVPALLALTDLPMKSITATSMGVIALVATGAVANASFHGQLDWGVALPFAAGAFAGVVAGRWLADHLAGPRLKQAFAALALVVTAGLLVRAVTLG